MLTSHTRLIAAAFAGSLGLAACGGAGSPSSIAPPAQPMQRASETANGHCKMLPLVDPRTRLQQARSGRYPSPLICGARAARQSGTRPNTRSIQVFDVPGSIGVSDCGSYDLFNDCGTFGSAINASGTIVGYYLNTSDAIAGFIRTPDATYTSFQALGQWPTYPYDLTNGGTIAGEYFDGQDIAYAFVRNKNGALAGYQAPWASQIPNDSVGQGTSAGALNPRGETGGIYFDSQGAVHGFLRKPNGSFVQVSPDGAVSSSVCIACLNNRGASAGDYTDSTGVGRGFRRSATGAFITIAKHGAVDTGLTGINNHNNLLGFYVDTNSVVWGLIRAHNKRIVFQDPKASETYGNGTQPEAINDAGAVTGLYADAQGVVHGFYRSPTGHFSEFDPQGSVYTEPFAINANGTVTGWWYDAQGANHGFIWTPQ